MKKLILLLFTLCVVGSAQVLITVATQTTDPVGNCTVQLQQLIVNTANQKLWFCNSTTGAWVSTPVGAGTTGTGAVVLQTAPTITAPVIATVTNTGTVTLPTSTGGVPIVIACGATSGATATCANTAVGATSKVYFGSATLASNASVITISPGYTSSSTYFCVGQDVTTRANPVQVVSTSATTFTITNTTGATDVVQYQCVGY